MGTRFRLQPKNLNSWCVCLVMCCLARNAFATDQELRSRIENLRAQYSSVQRGRMGFKFVSVSDGRVLAADGSSTFFTPASNTKLYTTACALVRLGANYKFRTEVRTSGEWRSGQTSVRDLMIVGGGDPNLSGRSMPYLVDAGGGDPLQVLKELSTAIYDTGVREIDGDVTGVATRYPGDLYPDGWTMDDSDYGYGAPVSALTLNDNTAGLVLRPTEPGELADIELSPAGQPLIVLNQVVTVPGKESHIYLRRPAASNEFVLGGTIGQAVDQWNQEVAIGDPALWAAECLVDLLRGRGIQVRGQARSEYSANENNHASALTGTLITAKESVPLSQAIQVVNKVSQNLHAEMLLREVAVVRGQPGTLDAGLKERRAFLKEIGITPEGSGFALVDGSGLARQDLTTPDSTVALLLNMWKRPERDIWVESLPVGGRDGTLQRRFRGMAGADRVHAKTGSLSHVNALSGYIETRHHGWIAFSVMVNGTIGHEAEVREFMDKLCGVFLDM